MFLCLCGKARWPFSRTARGLSRGCGVCANSESGWRSRRDTSCVYKLLRSVRRCLFSTAGACTFFCFSAHGFFSKDPCCLCAALPCGANTLNPANIRAARAVGRLVRVRPALRLPSDALLVRYDAVLRVFLSARGCPFARLFSTAITLRSWHGAFFEGVRARIISVLVCLTDLVCAVHRFWVGACRCSAVS